MVDRAVGPDCLSLDVEFLNRHLEMTVDDYKVERFLELLDTEWNAGRKNFAVFIAAVIIGNVYTAAALTCTWLRWSLHQLIGAMKVLTRANYNRLARTRHFDNLYAEQDKQWLDLPTKSFAHCIFPNRSIIKAVWQYKNIHFLTKAIHTELRYIQILFKFKICKSSFSRD